MSHHRPSFLQAALVVVMLCCSRGVLAFTSSARPIARKLHPTTSISSLSMSTESSPSTEPAAKRQKVESIGDNKDGAPTQKKEDVPLYRSEGLFAVNKPLEWTSNNVVSYIRGILEKDARNRGAEVRKPRRSRKKGVVRVGHGGTLDPMASGVLVVGVGSGTKELQGFLSGSKRYTAGVKLGFQTDTLDMEGNVTDTKPFDHVTMDAIEDAIPKFTGKVMQIPPIYSALRKDGKKLYEQARAGKTAEDIGIEAREVTILPLDNHALVTISVAMDPLFVGKTKLRVDFLAGTALCRCCFPASDVSLIGSFVAGLGVGVSYRYRWICLCIEIFIL